MLGPPPMEVAAATRVRVLLLADEADDAGVEEGQPGPSLSQAPGSSAGGVSASTGATQPPVPAGARQGVVAKAREAAAGVVAESSSEASADAAERALRAGQASSGIDFSSLGGVGELLRALREQISLPLRAPHLFEQYKIRPPRGVLLYGPPGSGKTVLARAAAADSGATLFVINGPDVVSEYYGESEACLRGIWAAARALSPALIFIDEVDALAPARQAASGGTHAAGDMSSRLVTVLLTLLDGAEGEQQQQADAGRHQPVVVIAATNRPQALDPALRRPGRLERELEVGVPSPAARLDILRARLRPVRHSLSDADVEALAAAAHGFVSADLAALVDEAAMCALRRAVAAPRHAGTATTSAAAPASSSPSGPGSGGSGGGSGGAAPHPASLSSLAVTLEDFRAAETRVRPSAMRQVAVEVPNVRWGDVGGLDVVKQALREAVEWPHKAPGALARLGAQPPRGVLLYGPPGCSKTLLARAVAAEARLNFLSIKGGELFSKYVGESEKAIAAVFARARATAPSVIFFDEIDGLAGTRSGMLGGGGDHGGGGGGVGERVISQLLTEMDGLQELLGVTVLAATNRPDCVDPALMRPGRFDRLLYVPPPDAHARAEIYGVQLRRCPLAADVDLCRLAAVSEGYTGADISAVVREAALAALEEDMAAEQVAARHFDAALAAVPPSAPPSSELLALYEGMQRVAAA